MKKPCNFLQLLKLRKNKAVKIALVLSFVADLLAVFAFQRMDILSGSSGELRAGTVAEKEIVADADIRYVDKNAMSKLKYDAEKKISPIFKVDRSITANTNAAFGEFASALKGMFDRNAEYDEFVSFGEELKSRGYSLDPDFLYGMGKSPSAPSILEAAGALLDELMHYGVLEKNLTGYDKNMNIEVWRWNENLHEKEDVLLGDLITIDKVADFVKDRSESVQGSGDLKAVVLFVTQFARDNLFFDYDATSKKKETLLANIAPVYKTIMAGDVIVKKGFVISDSDMEKIEALRGASRQFNISRLLGTVVFMALIFLIAGAVVPPAMEGSKARKNSYMLFFLVLAESFFLAFMLLLGIRSAIDSMVAVIIFPAALFAMLLSIVCGILPGVIFAFVASLVVFMLGLEGSAVVFTLLTGIAASLVVRNYSKRIQLIRSGIFLGIIDMVMVLCFIMAVTEPNAENLIFVIYAFLNGLGCSILCLGVLPIVEHIMNVPTQSRLAELSDLNTPVLQKMLHLASGTFNHSILVGNLAETACIEINANGLLARVGGYYHDIGKIDQSEFFIENQESYNRHDDLSPSLSVSIIKSHVKYGIEKAKELNLPQEVIDIIAHHHGNGLIAYFYVEAMKLEDKAKVTPEAYSYSDGRPKSKEEAVVLLADNVEAAVRALKAPTVPDIQKRVGDIIRSKIESQQLSECDLTFSDLKTIEKSFVNTLRGIHHSRIQYPKQEEINELSSDKK